MNYQRITRTVPVLALMLTGCFGGGKLSWSQAKGDFPPASAPVLRADENLLPPPTCVRFQSPDTSRPVRSASPFVTGAPAEKKSSWTDSISGWFHKTGDALKPKEKVVPPEDPLSLSNQPKEIGADLYLAIAQMAEQQGQWEKAEKAYRDALEKAPTDRLVLIGYARMKHRQQLFAEAEDLYARAIESHPNDPVAFNDLSFCYARQKKYEEALLASAAAVKLDPQSVLYRNNLARLLIATNRPAEALEQLHQVHRPADAYYNLGVLLYQNDDPAGALSCFEKAYQTDPQHQGAWQMLVQAGRLQPPSQPQVPPDAAVSAPNGTPGSNTRVDMPPVETPSEITVQGRRALPPSTPVQPSGAAEVENQYGPGPSAAQTPSREMVVNPYVVEPSAADPSRLPPVGSESFDPSSGQYHLSDPVFDGGASADPTPAANVELQQPNGSGSTAPVENPPAAESGDGHPNRNHLPPPRPTGSDTSLRMPAMSRDWPAGPAQGMPPTPHYDPSTVSQTPSARPTQYTARRQDDVPTLRIPVGPRQPVDMPSQYDSGYSAPLPGAVAPRDYSNSPGPRFLPVR